jgi:hypothetical protein
MSSDYINETLKQVTDAVYSALVGPSDNKMSMEEKLKALSSSQPSVTSNKLLQPDFERIKPSPNGIPNYGLNLDPNYKVENFVMVERKKDKFVSEIIRNEVEVGDKERIPLTIIDYQPAHLPVPASEPAEGSIRYWIEYGDVNGLLPTNLDSYHDITSTTHFFVKITLNSDPDSSLANSVEIVKGASNTTYSTPPWGIDGSRPANTYYYLGSVTINDDSFAILNTGGGSLSLTEHISNISPSGAIAGDVSISKQFAFIRQNY